LAARYVLKKKTLNVFSASDKSHYVAKAGLKFLCSISKTGGTMDIHHNAWLNHIHFEAPKVSIVAYAFGHLRLTFM
jgi:hypothetical protein